MAERLAHPDYGIDAPGLRAAFLGVGTGASLLFLAAMLLWPASITPAMRTTFVVVTTLIAAYGFGMGIFMTWGSRVAKLRTRDRLLGITAARRGWRGDERVLDVGCGRGLMAIGAAKRLEDGVAIGIDLWRAEDQSENSPQAFLENARREGVAGRVRVETGDARRLPLRRNRSTSF